MKQKYLAEAYKMEVLNNIPFNIGVTDILDELRIKKKPTSIERSIFDLIEKIKSVVKPKILYKAAEIEAKHANSVIIEGVEITSSILSGNSEIGDTVFPHIITSGTELESIDISQDGYLKKMLFDAIKELALETAVDFFEIHLKTKYGFKIVSAVNPGAPQDWPVTQQPVLFSIFGNVEELIGVKLTKNFMMDPVKSISGVYFSTGMDYMNCRLCPQEHCLKRKAEYNEILAEKYGKADSY
jgi:hypothetical protein